MPGRINVLNRSVSLDTVPEFEPFTGVRLWYDDDACFVAGDDTGRVLEADCPWATQVMADNILSSVSGYAYQPFDAASAILDPAAELGDGVNVGGVYAPLAAITTRFDAMCAADISAPADEEIDHEYPYMTRQQREMQRKVKPGQSYHGTRITRQNGLEVVKTGADGTESALVRLNSDELVFYNADGQEALYFDAIAGKYRFRGDVEITGGTMNVNNNFIVDKDGNLTINGNINLSGGSITWGANAPESSGISSEEALTLINHTLVSSPRIEGAEIYGGIFSNLDEVSFIRMRSENDFEDPNDTSMVHVLEHFVGNVNDNVPVTQMGYVGGHVNMGNGVIVDVSTWTLFVMGNMVLTRDLNTGIMKAYGRWDFSGATVTGL